MKTCGVSRMTVVAALAAILAVVVGSAAQGDSIMYSDSVALSSTNWSSSVTIPKFDPSWGTLISITCQLTGHVEGTAKFESMDNSPAAVSMNLSAMVKLERPDCSTMVLALPLASTLDCVTAYDGTLDYGGTSGVTHAGLSNTDVQSVTTPPPNSDLALFTGVGNIVLPVVATGTSSGSGAGNLILNFATAASAGVEVTYDYRAIPEPATMALVGTAGLALVGLRRRRSMK